MADEFIHLWVVHHTIKPVLLAVENADQDPGHRLRFGIAKNFLKPLGVARQEIDQRAKGAFFPELAQNMHGKEQRIGPVVTQAEVVGILAQEIEKTRNDFIRMVEAIADGLRRKFLGPGQFLDNGIHPSCPLSPIQPGGRCHTGQGPDFSILIYGRIAACR